MIMVIVIPFYRLGGIGEGPGMRSKEFILFLLSHKFFSGDECLCMQCSFLLMEL
jgi:hypothetical protein